jgi:hypothetical protein
MLASGCIVALDVAKQKFMAALATLAGEVVEVGGSGSWRAQLPFCASSTL